MLIKKVLAGSFDPSKDKVFVPKPGHIFVFGSNLAGIHGGGAAKLAKEKYGAVMFKGEGLMGQIYGKVKEKIIGWSGENGCGSYALPTKGFDIETLPLEVIQYFVDRLGNCAEEHPELHFFVTRVGCGLGGYTDMDIAPLFAGVWPDNVTLPKGW